MDHPSSELLLFNAILTLGLSAWSLIVAANNVVGFSGAAGAIARTMSMKALEDEPRIDSPFYARKLTDPAWSRVALCIIVGLQIAGAGCLAFGGVKFFLACLGSPLASSARAAATLGFGALSFAWICMMSGGLWFGYWIRQEGLQLTHIALLAMTVVSVLVVNV